MAAIIISLATLVLFVVLVLYVEKIHTTLEEINRTLYSMNQKESKNSGGYKMRNFEEEYYISALPEGFEKTEDERTENSIDISYFRENDYILFTQYTKSYYEQNYDNEYTEYKEHIDGDEKYLVIENEYDSTYIWDNGKYIFTIQSNLNKDSILKLCKSTKIK
ncbi:MAG: DUF4367 domain-containing protein [Ruminococcus sp.]|nr:DUF4367 domain-containing protein [Ruminococcus sp.]